MTTNTLLDEMGERYVLSVLAPQQQTVVNKPKYGSFQSTVVKT